MEKKKRLIYPLLSISIGYLIYSYIFTDYRQGMMMSHHYEYYNEISRLGYYLNNFFLVVSYVIIIVGTIILLSKDAKSRSDSLTILDERLSKGEISIDEYKTLKRIIQNK